jgi:hypothetical protein
MLSLFSSTTAVSPEGASKASQTLLATLSNTRPFKTFLTVKSRNFNGLCNFYQKYLNHSKTWQFLQISVQIKARSSEFGKFMQIQTYINERTNDIWTSLGVYIDAQSITSLKISQIQNLWSNECGRVTSCL